MFSRIINLFYSCYCFFFRIPITFERKFSSDGILLGPILQSVVYIFMFCLFRFFLGEYLSAFFALIGLSVATGFFHEDGLADTADSLGVPHFSDDNSSVKIVNALKDSRIGSYGANALCLLWLIRFLLTMSTDQAGISIFLAIGLSRLMVLSMGHYLIVQSSSTAANHSQQSHQLADTKLKINIVFTSLQSFIFFMVFYFSDVKLSTLGSIFLLCTPVIVDKFLKFLGKRTRGINGDYMGAAICLVECCFLLLISLSNPSQFFNIIAVK